MKTNKPYVLLAEDDPDDRDFFCAGMRRVFPQIAIRTFEGGNELLDFLRECPPSDLPVGIILDYSMTPHNASLVLMATAVGTPYVRIPKIVWTTSARQKELEECIRLGAARYIVKPGTEWQFDNFLRSIGYLWDEPVKSRMRSRNLH